MPSPHQHCFSALPSSSSFPAIRESVSHISTLTHARKRSLGDWFHSCRQTTSTLQGATPQTGGQIVKSRDRKRIGRNLRESGQQKKNGINEVKKNGQCGSGWEGWRQAMGEQWMQAMQTNKKAMPCNLAVVERARRTRLWTTSTQNGSCHDIYSSAASPASSFSEGLSAA